MIDNAELRETTPRPAAWERYPRKWDDPRRGETGVVLRFGSGGSSRTHSAVTGGATAEGQSDEPITQNSVAITSMPE
ncbi:hypothetical protein Prubr_21660 [Polymorphospora rubra]|uniref:Uncharacterized protein n=1 Tax=Polymorphospora rubra TaxID=338584 RepID=A0A810N0N7_9ACTN|nr:hypothetical protein Prubr_21660 [Polymorphospora rubra]